MSEQAGMVPALLLGGGGWAELGRQREEQLNKI